MQSTTVTHMFSLILNTTLGNTYYDDYSRFTHIAKSLFSKSQAKACWFCAQPALGMGKDSGVGRKSSLEESGWAG